MSRRAIALHCVVAWTCLAGCAETGEGPVGASEQQQQFETQVWPILVRDCGYPACHGSPDRFLRVLGPGHARLDPQTRLGDPVTPQEMTLSFERARSMLDPTDAAASPLLRKSLAVDAGGSGHEGTDVFGHDVYRTVDDPSFTVLVQWARSSVRPQGDR